MERVNHYGPSKATKDIVHMYLYLGLVPIPISIPVVIVSIPQEIVNFSSLLYGLYHISTIYRRPRTIGPT